MIAEPFQVKKLKLKNRIVMAPMCQYSVDKEDGIPNDWHFVHYVSRAVGGAGLIIMEMTGVEPDGRITNQDLGLWSDDQVPAYKRIINEVHNHGAKIGIQIAHAGRKAEDAKQPVGASNIPVEVLPEETKNGKLNPPRALETNEVERVVTSFKEAAKRAVKAGFDTIELHGAHGYLLHQFMSPSINTRTDKYGEDLSRFGVEVIKAVKSVMPQEMPLIMRVSAIEYIDGGYDIEHALKIAKKFRDAGVDVFHISSGGEGLPGKKKPLNSPGYQVPFARRFKDELNVPVIAVGRLETPQVAEAVLSNQDADLIAVARGMLNDPYWGLHAIKEIDKHVTPPKQYGRAIR
ncbi:NADH:flavin oxidoreductase/NADH oxidase [Shouchella clausii]|uniref:NADH:flavin oxidoreductase/NADH oxidase n=1 Tax=Shouchella clausii TaxID=79880 RepID=UPI000B97B99C|nr:NADH:flavin oxidoreductase/NADH oxidase [Shouchella clausii]AST95461.1 NADPH dehydrogenase [Shouchella clausii]MBU8598031.1 NADH:flavin oxidoreductase/NADH oxidase [Shouchella clausii]MCR1288760.1 NADH:flavin oxidoreductase/NADH oxidase [Shouchella clausii]MCY1105655.1 NADH:flavin oxidoreductase/NADH oxidase [Shouchella clausii]MEB5473821.1 NADH:flavin oxidoreductase/NADH oxidase [Shouchella clausii]